MTNEVFVVRDDVSWRGLRRVHVIRGGEAVDVDEVLAERGVRREDLEGLLVYEEEGLGVHHARLYWREESGEWGAESG